MSDDRDILERLLEPKLGMTTFEHINLRESAAIEISRLRAINDKYRKTLEIIAGQPQCVLEAMQARVALDNIGPDVE